MSIRFNRLLSVRATLMLVCALAAGISQARAQDPLSRFLDGIFKQEQPAPQAAPVENIAPPPPAQLPPVPPQRGMPAGASPQTLAPATLPPSGAGQSMDTGARPASAAMPLPPRRPTLPDDVQTAQPAPAAPVATAAPVQPVSAGAPSTPVATTAAPPRQTPAQPSLPRTSAEALARLNAYLNGINTLTATFTQMGADGRQTSGSLYVQRPGRLRFAYDPPSTLEIVADGRSVAIRDKKLRTNDVYSIGQTPLKFLLRDNIDLARDLRVKDVQIDPSGVIEARLEDTATIGGTSTVTLSFDARADVLRQWVVLDPQGYETTVHLSNVQVARR